MNGIRSLLKCYDNLPIVAKAAMWYTICSIIQKGMAVISTPIFTRMMTTEQFGQFSIYISWLHILTIFVTLRLDGAVFNKGMSKYKADRDVYTASMQSYTIIITLILLLIYLLFREQINQITELPTFIMAAIFVELLVTPAISFWTLRKRYEYIYKQVVLCVLLMAFVSTVLGIVVVFVSSEKGYARILSSVLVNCVFGFLMLTYNYKKSNVFLKKEYIKYAVGFNLPLLLHYFSQYVLSQFDRIMIQKMVSMAAAGIYSVSYSVGMLLKIVSRSIVSAITPWQYKCLEKNEHKKMDDMLYPVFLIVACCSFFISGFAPEIMKILADKRYHEGVYVIPPVSMGLFFSFMYTVFANVEFYYDKNKFSMYISCAGAIINIILNYFCIQKFGFLAAAYTTLICYVFFAMGHYFYMSKSVKESTGVPQIFNTKRLLLLSLGVLTYGIIIIYFYDDVLIRYALIVLIVITACINGRKIFRVMNAIKKKNV